MRAQRSNKSSAACRLIRARAREPQRGERDVTPVLRATLTKLIREPHALLPLQALISATADRHEVSIAYSGADSKRHFARAVGFRAAASSKRARASGRGFER